MKTKIYIWLPILLLGFLFFSCEKKLDVSDPSSISANGVWDDVNLANAYLASLYNNLMPNKPTNGGSANSDEAGQNYFVMTDRLKGTANINSWGGFDYGNIRNINLLLTNIDGGTLADADKKFIKGQAYFWRAWVYYSMVKNFGGVPLVLKPQDENDTANLFLPRNKTSECFTQILADLDAAIANLPDLATGNDVGKIDKCIAMSFKGRVLLMWASPLFNVGGDKARWQTAYDANKAALALLDANGKGLYPNFNNIWYDNLNKEVIMVKQYKLPDNTYFEGGLIPAPFEYNAFGADLPSLELVNAFPMKNGSAWNETTMSYDTLWRHRDARFYATIAYNGCNTGLQDFVNNGVYLWTWHSVGNGAVSLPEASLFSGTSFYRNKMIQRDLSRNTAYKSTLPWPEIRYTEVYMAYGEAANEIDKPAEALDVLYKVRQRAEIEAGTGNYGITASTKAAIREAYLKERFVEFAFENKRWNDLRRLRRFDVLNTLKRRHGFTVMFKDNSLLANYPNGAGPRQMQDIEQIWNLFRYDKIEVDAVDMNVKDNYYIYPIPQSEIDSNSKLIQNIGWNNGTFDPLQ